MSDQLDHSIPVLTDIISLEDVELNTQPIAHQASNHLKPAAPISEEDWQRLEQTLRENVLRQVLSRIDFVLEHRIRDSLADVLQTTVERLSEDIRAGLQQTLSEVIQRAVTQEISKAKSSRP